MLKCKVGKDERLPKYKYEIELDPDLVDIVLRDDLTYSIFWNTKYFVSQDSLKALLSGDTIPALIVVNEYEPMVVRAEVIDKNDIGFTAYRSDGKAIISGEATVYSDHIDFRTDPIYRHVKFACTCTYRTGGQKYPPPQAAPSSPGNADK